jgi:hypothetical protein
MFAVLPAPASRGRDRQRELTYAFEGMLPLPIDECQIAFAINGTEVIGCACERSALMPMRQNHEIVTPSRLPEWLGVSEPERCLKQLNLLRGEMRSQIRQSRMRTTLKLVSGIMCVITVLVVYMSQQRLRMLSQQSITVREDIQALYDGVLPSDEQSTQPDAIRFATVLNELARTRTGAGPQHHEDLVADLAYILAQWPSDSQAQLQQIRLDASTAQLSVSVPDNDRALSILDYLTDLDGWDVRSRDMHPTQDRVNLNVQIARSDKELPDA